MNIRHLIMATTLPLLSACGGGDDPQEFCTQGFSLHGAFGGPSTAGCPLCSVSDTAAGFDGDGKTATVFSFDPIGGQVSYDVITSGHAFPAGSVAGAYMHFPRQDSGGYINPGVTVSTYYDGSLQESFTIDSTLFGNIEGAGQDYFYGAQTTQKFVQLRVTISLSGAVNGETVSVYELCGDY